MKKNPDVLSKVKISGGGRCNVTHACFDNREFCENYPRGSKELLGPFHQFCAQETIDWFQNEGVTLKTESDGRIFPTSNSSQTIIDCLMGLVKKLGIRLWTNCQVTAIQKLENSFKLRIKDAKDVSCHQLILATGSSRIDISGQSH